MSRKNKDMDIVPPRDRKKNRSRYFTFFYRSRWITTYTEDNPKKPTKYVIFMWAFSLAFLVLGLVFISNEGSVGAGVFMLLSAMLFFFVGLGFIRQWREFKRENGTSPNCNRPRKKKHRK